MLVLQGKGKITRADIIDVEETLVLKAKRGDAEAFGRLVERFAARLLNVARAILGSDAEAWDAVQEALVAAWRNIAQFEGRSSFYTWVRSIVVNACRMERRRKARRGIVISLDGTGGANAESGPGTDHQPWESPDPAPGPDKLVEEKAFYADFMRALDSLPPYYSEVFWLREAEGLSYQEIADMLGINLGTVRSRLAAARRLLREKLDSAGWSGKMR